MKAYHSCYLGVSPNDVREIANNVDHSIKGAEQLVANEPLAPAESKSFKNMKSTDAVSDQTLI